MEEWTIRDSTLKPPLKLARSDQIMHPSLDQIIQRNVERFATLTRRTTYWSFLVDVVLLDFTQGAGFLALRNSCHGQLATSGHHHEGASGASGHWVSGTHPIWLGLLVRDPTTVLPCDVCPSKGWKSHWLFLLLRYGRFYHVGLMTGLILA